MSGDPPRHPYNWNDDPEWGDRNPNWQTWLALILATVALGVGFWILYTVAADLP